MKTFYYIMVSIRQLNPNENPRLLGCLSPFFLELSLFDLNWRFLKNRWNEIEKYIKSNQSYALSESIHNPH